MSRRQTIANQIRHRGGPGHLLAMIASEQHAHYREQWEKYPSQRAFWDGWVKRAHDDPRWGWIG